MIFKLEFHLVLAVFIFSHLNHQWLNTLARNELYLCVFTVSLCVCLYVCLSLCAFVCLGVIVSATALYLNNFGPSLMKIRRHSLKKMWNNNLFFKFRIFWWLYGEFSICFWMLYFHDSNFASFSSKITDKEQKNLNYVRLTLLGIWNYVWG